MRIIVPIDFSPNSESAVNYALGLARDTFSELVLLHTVYIDAPPRASLSLLQIEDAMMQSAEAEMLALKKYISRKNRSKVPVEYLIRKGFPLSDVVKKVAKTKSASMVVMGTKGATGLSKVVLGSNTVDMMDQSDLAIMSVPLNSPYKKLKNILLLTDGNNTINEIKKIMPLAASFDSRIIVMNASVLIEEQEKIRTTLEKKSPYTKYEYLPVVSNDIETAVDELVAKNKADLVVTFRRELNFIQRILSRSTTRNISFSAHLPLLSYKK
jgi:nucleotide-binding universal stress UspA family protein